MPMSGRLLRPRQTGFDPRSIAGIALWLDAADVGTLFQNRNGTIPVTAEGQPIFRWNDKSGNGRNATAPRVVTQLNLANAGSGYTLPPILTISDSGGGIGSGATGTATISGGSINALTLTARGTQYNNPIVTVTNADGDTTGAGAAVTATATAFATRASAPAGVVLNTLNTGGNAVPSAPYMALPALTIPNSHTVFGVFTRVDSQFSLPIGSGFDTPSFGSPQGSRYAAGLFADNIVYTASVSQGAFTTHPPRQGLSGEVVIIRSVRAAGTSVATLLNDLPVSTITSGNPVTQAATGSWSAVGADVATTSQPSSGNQVLRPHRGALHEVIVYDRALTPEEQATVTEYLRAKWAVIFGSRFNLNWRFTGASAWPGFRWSIANTIATTTVADALSTPTGSYPGNSAFNGGVLLPDGRVFCVPRSSITARIYDPVTDILTTPNGSYPGSTAFIGGVLLLDGRVFCVPSNSTSARIYDPSTDILTTPSGSYPGAVAFAGGVLLPDGRVFCVPYNSTSARIYDPVTDILTTPSGSYPGGGAFVGGVLLPDGRVFCVPSNSTSARIYDPSTNTLIIPAGTYAGGAAFAGGVLLPDGRVFCVPSNSTSARIYDPATNTLFASLRPYPTSAAFAGGVLLPDGRVFCVPHNNGSARIYDPSTDILTTPSGSYPGAGAFGGGVALPDGRVFCVPFNSFTARIYGGGGGFDINVILSAYFNKL